MTMDDLLRRRFAGLDAVAVPDLRAEVDRRATALAQRATTATVRGRTTGRPGAARDNARRPARLARGSAIALAVALVVLAATLAVGAGWLFTTPPPLPSETPSRASQTPPTAPARSATPGDGGLVAYSQGSAIWVVNSDGTGGRVLVPAAQGPIGWLPGASRLLFSTDKAAAIGIVDARSSEVETYGSPCPVEVVPTAVLDLCVAQFGAAPISPDGTRLAYAFSGQRGESGREVKVSAIATLNLTSGVVTKLESTQTSNPWFGETCATAASTGENHAPAWSADGTSLVFTRDSIGPAAGGECQAAVVTVNVDGTNLRAVPLPDALQGEFPVWSPDGSVFFFNARGNVYTGRSDFTDIRAVTSDGVSGGSAWTRDGRIVFLRSSAPASIRDRRSDVWIMDRDGGHSTRLEATVPALTAAGCLVCPYPVYRPGVVDPSAVRTTPPYEALWITSLFWQPAP